MNFLRFASAIFLIAVGSYGTCANAQSVLFNAAPTSAVVKTPQVRAELLAWAPDGVQAGKPVWLGLQLAHQPDWHTYWKNSGDSGLPTTVEWQLPAGITAGDIAWPTPRKIPLGTLANYGYEGTVLLPVPLTIAPDFAGSQVDVKLKAVWLVCRKECIPQEGNFNLRIQAKGSTAMDGAQFEAAFKNTPAPRTPSGFSNITVSGNSLNVRLHDLPADWQAQKLAFFPEAGNLTQPAATWSQEWISELGGFVWQARIPLSAQRLESPATMAIVVVPEARQSGEMNPGGFRFELPVKGIWPAAAPVAVVPPALQAALAANAANSSLAQASGAGAPGTPPIGLLAALLGALLGGVLLNLMPCVFPVLAIKVVGFVNEKSQATRLGSGLAYSAGVVLSYLALGALLLSLRAAGDQLGWGFQLQNPAVVAGLAALFTLLGLNLAGVFEFGSLLPARLAGAQPKNPAVNAFLSGVLATAIASPCTAPFMGASLGLAVGLPAVQALAVFAAIGVGMALPYLVASAVPAVARALPRPGAWMVTFKQLMAFPMFATVAWLVWVLGQQSGIDGAGALLALLVLLALAAWGFGLHGRGRVLALVSAAVLGAAGLWALGPRLVQPADGPRLAQNSRWQDWQPGRVEQLSSQGRTVFVDFTAAWCVTCQYNKSTTLSDPALLADFGAKNVALLRADWTRRDPAITQALAALGRSGVPVYVLYQPGRAPVVLSEILSVADVKKALAGG